MTWGYDKPDRKDRGQFGTLAHWAQAWDRHDREHNKEQACDGPLSFGDLDDQFAEQAAATVAGSSRALDDGQATALASEPSEASRDALWLAQKLVAMDLESDLSRPPLVYQVKHVNREELIAMYPQATTKRYLKATANGADWDSARRAVAKVQDLLDDESKSRQEHEEDMVRIVARVVARARTRGRRDILEALDLDTDDCFDEVKE